MSIGRITPNTLVPISALTVIAAVIFWVGILYAKTYENGNSILELKVERKSLEEKVDEVNSRLNRIEGYLSKFDTKAKKNDD